MYELSEQPVTLRRVWSDYQVTRKLKPVTLKNYSQRLNTYLRDWLDLPVSQITKEMVEQRHAAIPGQAMANSTFRTLRALLHYAYFKYEDAEGNPVIKRNPVHRLSELRAWHRDHKRRTMLPLNKVREFFEGVFALENVTMRDFLITLLLTGMRRSEALNLRWEHVNLQVGTIKLFDTKNGDDFEIPMSDYLWKLLTIRHMGKKSEFVFPGPSRDKPFTAAWNCFQPVREHVGVNFSLHDLRRTFCSMGDELNLKEQVVQQLVNHRPSSQTEEYTVRSIERLRRETQKITNGFLGAARML